MSLEISLNNQEHILAFLLSFQTIIELYHYYNGSITLYYITKLYYISIFHIYLLLLSIKYRHYYSVSIFILDFLPVSLILLFIL